MNSIDISTMRSFLTKSIASNRQRNVITMNKVYGMLAEIDLRNTLIQLGYGGRISQGGWIVRNVGSGKFGHHTIVLFPMTIALGSSYPPGRTFEIPPNGLHTICSTMHQIGVHSYYCVPEIQANNNFQAITWYAKQLGVPEDHPYTPLLTTIANFSLRSGNYNFLRYSTNISTVLDSSIPEEFTKEHLRVTFQTRFMQEMVDIDGVFWGQQFTYPIEIKEKTSANDSKLGDYFGIDVGPFVKLAFYAAKRGNLRSLFIVKEIDTTTSRNLVQWWFITFDTLAQYASWQPIGGGTNMQGGGSTVVKIPKSEFKELNAANLALL